MGGKDRLEQRPCVDGVQDDMGTQGCPWASFSRVLSSSVILPEIHESPVNSAHREAWHSWFLGRRNDCILCVSQFQGRNNGTAARI